METCPGGTYAKYVATQNEEWQEDGDDTALNSICLICTNDKWLCSSKGFWGKWYYSATNEEGFTGADFKYEPNQGWPDDDTAGVNIALYHDNDSL